MYYDVHFLPTGNLLRAANIVTAVDVKVCSNTAVNLLTESFTFVAP